tara:strand:+ start:778 stop:1050 length:273 start_codon:yes stop_codon:yes gene_type:complete
MPNITITITESEIKALEYVAVSPQEWSENAVTERARVATNDIVRLYTERALDEGISIPVTRDAIIMDAYAREWIRTAANINNDPIPERVP